MLSCIANHRKRPRNQLCLRPLGQAILYGMTFCLLNVQFFLHIHMVFFCVAKIHSDEGLTLETSVFESFTVANLPYRPCG